MPDVKFSNQYPYTDFHELNLDWVIKTVSNWKDLVGNTIQSIEKTGTAGLVDTYTITYSDGSTSTFNVTNGNGIASVAKTGTVGLVDTYTITFQDGSTTAFNVTNGNGVASVEKTGTVGLVDTYTITYSDGSLSTFDVHNGTASIDPTLTLSDYAADAKVVGDTFDTFTEKITIESTNLISSIDSGYYYNGNLNPSTSYSHTNEIPVSPGDVISLQYGAPHVRTFGYMRWIDKHMIDDTIVGEAPNTQVYTVPANVKAIRLSGANVYFGADTAAVRGKYLKPYEPYFTPYEKTLVKYDNQGRKLHIYLPPFIYAGIGRTVELYNSLVCLEAERYHINWSGAIGVAYERKLSITGTTAGSYLISLKITDDDLNVIYSGASVVKVHANSISTQKKIIPIGDSLTNLKAWLQEVQTLSSNKILYIGTRGRSDSPIRHEGRSGWSAELYNTNTPYTFDNNYQGATGISGTVNPFWDGSKFSLSHYITTQSGTIGTPDAVQIFLGTNGLALDNTSNVGYIKELVDNIRSEYPTMPIFVCNTIYRSNQNGYYSVGGDNYTAVPGYQFEEDCKIMNLQNMIQAVFESYTDLYIIPLSICMDREYDFGNVPTPVNPRLSTVTIDIPVESVHPQEPGYLQMADVMYSAYVQNLT